MPRLPSSASIRSAARTRKSTRTGHCNTRQRKKLGFETVEARDYLSSISVLSSQQLIKGGDANSDGSVGMADLIVLMENFGLAGATWGQGDFTGDDLADFADFLLLASNFEPVVASAASTATLQQQSIANREIHSSGYADFKSATSMPAVSPALSAARAGDLTVTYNEMLGPQRVTAVVLKPRATAGTYQIPRPSDGTNAFQFLETHLRAAKAQGVGLIKYPAGHVFEIYPPVGLDDQPAGALEQTAHLTLTGLQDTVIDFNGSTLDFMQLSLGLRIEDSQRIVLKNGTLRGQALLATVGKVVADDSPGGIRFDVLPEFRNRLQQSSNGMPGLVTVGLAELGDDGAWRLQAQGYAELFTNRGRLTNNFEYQSGKFVSTSALLRNENPFATGDFVWLLHENNRAHGVLLDNEAGAGVEDVSFEDISFVNIPGMAMVGEVKRGLHLNRAKMLVDPARSALLAVASDGVHLNANGGDIVIENSDFGPNGDDKITIKGNYWRVTALDRASKSLTVEPVEKGTTLSRWGWEGQRVVFIDRDYGVITETELAIDSVRPGELGNLHQVTLQDLPNQVKINSIIGNVDNAGSRVVIRNNEFNETRAQAILVQTSHVIVENNSFQGMGGPAIKLNMALEDWFEAISTRNVLIKDNRFERSSQSVKKTNGLIQIHQVDGHEQPVEVIDNVKIVGNRLNGSATTDPPPIDPPPTPTDPPEPAPTPGIDWLEVLYRNKEPGRYSHEIDAQIDLFNRSNTALNLKNAQIKYRLTNDGLTPEVEIKNSSVSKDALFASFDAAGAYASIQVVDDLFLQPQEKLKLRIQISNQEGRAFDQANDPSYVAQQTRLAPTDKIEVATTMVESPPNPEPPNPEPPNPEPPNPTPSVPSEVRVVYLNKSRQTNTDEIEAQLELYNDGHTGEDFRGIEIRYFFTPDGLTPQTRITSTNAPPNSLSAEYVSAGSYLAFRVNQELIVQPNERLKLRFITTNLEDAEFDQTNDGSFIASQAKRGISNQIQVWNQNEKLWGT